MTLVSLAFFDPFEEGTGLARFTPLSCAVVSEPSELEELEQVNHLGSSFPDPSLAHSQFLAFTVLLFPLSGLASGFSTTTQIG